jgi:hypothetical protein
MAGGARLAERAARRPRARFVVPLFALHAAALAAALLALLRRDRAGRPPPPALRQRVHPYFPRNFCVYDTVMYSGESHLLYLRVRALDAYVDRFVVGHSCWTFQGDPAPALSLSPLERELSAYDDKIAVFRACGPPRRARAWDREAGLRAFMQRAVASLRPAPDDLVVNTDCDEIPTRRGLQWVVEHPPDAFYKLSGLYFWYTFRWYVAGEVWRKASVVRWARRRSFQELRKVTRRRTPGVALVHCTYCFADIAAVVRKLRSFCHHEYAFEPFVNPSYILACAECGKALIPDQADRVSPYPGDVAEFVPFSHPAVDFLTRTVGFSDVGIADRENVSYFKRLLNCTGAEGK